jgi:hypothetical protein
MLTIVTKKWNLVLLAHEEHLGAAIAWIQTLPQFRVFTHPHAQNRHTLPSPPHPHLNSCLLLPRLRFLPNIFIEQTESTDPIEQYIMLVRWSAPDLIVKQAKNRQFHDHVDVLNQLNDIVQD